MRETTESSDSASSFSSPRPALSGYECLPRSSGVPLPSKALLLPRYRAPIGRTTQQRERRARGQRGRVPLRRRCEIPARVPLDARGRSGDPFSSSGEDGPAANSKAAFTSGESRTRSTCSGRPWRCRSPRRCRNVQEKVTEHPGNDHRVPELARRAGMSTRHFVRVFTQETGEPPALCI